MKYVRGDLFKLAPSQCVFLHSCNCFGHWGGGVAALFARKYPEALSQHEDYCHSKSPNYAQLLGTCQILKNTDVAGHTIVCLFTSLHGGSACDSPGSILKNTDLALQDLAAQWVTKDSAKTAIYMPKINSGIFRTPWSETEKILQKYEDRFDFTVVEYSP